MRYKIWWFLLSLLLLSAPALAAMAFPITGVENPDFVEFDKKFVTLLIKWHIPGAAVAMMKDDKLIYSRGFGWANKEKKIKVQPTSQFRIASVSKAITAVAILKLIEEKKLKLSDKVFDILSDIRPYGGHKFNNKIKNITVEDLLYMASGWIPRGKKHYDPMFGPWSKKLVNIIGYDNLPASCLDATKMMTTMPLVYKPGANFSYSNLDYCILGLIVGKVAYKKYGYQPYEKYVKEHVLKKLNISGMHIGSTNVSKRKPNEVHYYRYKRSLKTTHHGSPHYLPYSNIELLKKNFANGGWVASAPELVTFAHEVNDGDVLKLHSVKRMLTKPHFKPKNAKSYYAMGWKVKEFHGKKYWYQTGSFTGTNAMLINRSDGTAIAVVFNSRPPTNHLWTSFRPRLKRLFKTADSRYVLDAVNDLQAIV